MPTGEEEGAAHGMLTCRVLWFCEALSHLHLFPQYVGEVGTGSFPLLQVRKLEGRQVEELIFATQVSATSGKRPRSQILSTSPSLLGNFLRFV